MLVFISWYQTHQREAVNQSRSWELIVAAIVKILPSIYGSKFQHWFYNSESCYSSLLSNTLFWNPILLLQNQFVRIYEIIIVLNWTLIDIKQECSKLLEVITIYSSLCFGLLLYYNNVFSILYAFVIFMIVYLLVRYRKIKSICGVSRNLSCYKRITQWRANGKHTHKEINFISIAGM